MKRPSGVVRIFIYNWPIYVGTWVFALGALWMLFMEHRLGPATAILGVVPILWSGVSLFVSFYIYDWSLLPGGIWIAALLPASVESWATIHAGLDAEVELDSIMPGRCLARLDIFDPTVMTSGSIGRARIHTASVNAAVPSHPGKLKLQGRSCDAIVVAFTAHEIRDRRVREKFFVELHRCVRPGGRVVLVEHVRDMANFLAFGPGFLHFVPRREWLELASKARLVVAKEIRITPWIMALSLERIQ